MQLPDHLTKVPVGRERIPQEILTAHQCDRILAGAIDVFAKRGYQQTTIDNIVATSKSSVGSFYALFDGKEDCMLQAYDRIVGDVRARIVAAAPAEGSWAEQFCAGLREVLSFVSSEPLAARVALVEIQTAGDRALRRYEGTCEEVVDFLRRGRMERAAPGDLPPALERVTASGIAWLLHQRLVGRQAAEAESLFAELAEMVLSPYVGEAEATRLIKVGVPTPA